MVSAQWQWLKSANVIQCDPELYREATTGSNVHPLPVDLHKAWPCRDISIPQGIIYSDDYFGRSPFLDVRKKSTHLCVDQRRKGNLPSKGCDLELKKNFVSLWSKL